MRRPRRKGGGGEMNYMPEGCIAKLITFTSPPDACRLSAVSTLFGSAAESDAVWEWFLPPDYQSLISESERLTSSSSSLLSLPSKKDIYLSLCENPIVIDEGKKSFSWDKWSGKKCYMIAARALSIIWGDAPRYWPWTSLPKARYPEVAVLNDVCWLEIRGKISTCFLSPRTLYTAYLVFKQTKGTYGFKNMPVEVSAGLVGSEGYQASVCLPPESVREQGPQQRRWMQGLFGRRHGMGHPKERRDAWLEVELGDFYNAGDDEGELEMSVLEVKTGEWKRGLIVQGIEMRPKGLN